MRIGLAVASILIAVIYLASKLENSKELQERIWRRKINEGYNK